MIESICGSHNKCRTHPFGNGPNKISAHRTGVVNANANRGRQKYLHQTCIWIRQNQIERSDDDFLIC